MTGYATADQVTTDMRKKNLIRLTELKPTQTKSFEAFIEIKVILDF